MSRWKLSRRTCLRGMGGLTLGLPTLDAMLDGNGTALADGSALPTSYVACYGGYSLGSGDGKGNVNNPQQFTPDREGSGYDLKVALQPFADTFGQGKPPIQNEISVVSGLRIPWAGKEENNWDKIPPGGKPANFHGYTSPPQLTGVRTTFLNAPYGGPSSDQLVADAIPAGQKTVFPSLQYAVQARDYYSGSTIQSCSVRGDAKGIYFYTMAPQSSPQQAWKKLFTNFVLRDAGPEAERQFALLKKQNKSVLDAVLIPGRVQALLGRISARDRVALQEHFDNIRALEKQVGAASLTEAGDCKLLPDPGPDPKVGELYPDHTAPLGTTQAYSGEAERAKLFVQYAHMALACNRTRVVSLTFSMPQSDLNMYPILGDKIGGPLNVHGLTHNYNCLPLAHCIAWHMGHFASLVARLRDTSQGAGSLLDSSVLVFMHEGGFGEGSEHTDAENAVGGSDEHSTDKMAVLIAGRAGGLKPGRHIRAKDPERQHPANVLISAMNAAGLPNNKLGEISGNIPELFSAT